MCQPNRVCRVSIFTQNLFIADAISYEEITFDLIAQIAAVGVDELNVWCAANMPRVVKHIGARTRFEYTFENGALN